MTSSNGTVLAERAEHTGMLSVTAVTLSALICNTGFTTALPPALNGTHTTHIGTLVSASQVVDTSSLSTMLTEIRSNFELTAKELAQALGVSRPTLYAWSAGKSIPRPSNFRRAQALREASISWRLLIGDRTNSIAQQFNDKQSLLALLSIEDLPIEALSHELATLASERNAAPRVESIADRLRKLGFAEQSTAEQSRALESHGW